MFIYEPFIYEQSTSIKRSQPSYRMIDTINGPDHVFVGDSAEYIFRKGNTVEIIFQSCLQVNTNLCSRFYC